MLPSESFLRGILHFGRSNVTVANIKGVPEIPQALFYFKRLKKKFTSTCSVLSGNKNEEHAGEKFILNRTFTGTFGELQRKQESGRGQGLPGCLLALLLRELRC